jgi:hypothetical protein
MNFARKLKVFAFVGVAAIVTLGLFQTASAVNDNLIGTSIQVADFGAIGDGSSDDRVNVLKAFTALLSKTSPAALYFPSGKSYYLKRPHGAPSGFVFTMDGKRDITIDGQGATIILDHFDSAFSLINNKNITIKNLNVDYITPTFTQGNVTNINTSSYLDIEVSGGYPMPDPNAAKDFANSATFDNAGNLLRKINIFIERVEVAPIGTSANTLRVYPMADYLAELSKMQIGYKFAFRTYGHAQGRLFNINKNNGITLQNLGIYGTMGGSFLVNENEGDLLFDHIQIMRKPGTDRLIVGLADGLHVFDNRAHVTIRNCLIERLLDDGVNIGSMAEVAPNIYSDHDLDLRSTSNGNSSPELRSGDTISAYNLGDVGRTYFLGNAKITGVQVISTRVRHVVLDKPISGMTALSHESGNEGGQNLQDWGATRFFVDEIANPGYIIVNNVIRDKQRNGILAKGSRGLIRRNRIENLSGNGIGATNILKFNEGPFATELEVSGNLLDGIAQNGVVTGLFSTTKRPRGAVPVNLTIVNNIFRDLDSFAIKMINASGVNISGNTLASTATISAVNSTNITKNPFYSLFKIAGDVGIYFSSGLGYCKYESITSLKGVWGDSFADYMSSLNAPPNGRSFTGSCSSNEGVFSTTLREVYRGEHDGSRCRFGSMQDLQSLTGFSTDAHLKRINVIPSDATVSQMCKL